MEQKIIDGNKLIAEFEGYETYIDNGVLFVDYGIDEFGNQNERPIIDTHYHSSWDWLMPIIGKIACLGRSNFEDKINRKRVELFKDVSIFSTIQNMYSIVIEFIIWYNETNK